MTNSVQTIEQALLAGQRVTLWRDEDGELVFEVSPAKSPVPPAETQPVMLSPAEKRLTSSIDNRDFIA